MASQRKLRSEMNKFRIDGETAFLIIVLLMLLAGVGCFVKAYGYYVDWCASFHSDAGADAEPEKVVK